MYNYVTALTSATLMLFTFPCGRTFAKRLVDLNAFLKSSNCRHRCFATASSEDEKSTRDQRARKRATQQKRRQDGSRFIDELVVNIHGGKFSTVKEFSLV